MSRMWLAWMSLSSNRLINVALASSTSAEPRMMATTSSMLSRAMSSPSRMWARSLARCEAELGATHHDLELVAQVGVDQFGQVQHPGDPVDEGDAC